MASSARSHLSVPQVANAEGFQQENIVAVERGGPGEHFGGLGVHLVSPSHLEQSGVLFRVGHARSARAALEAHKHKRVQVSKFFINLISLGIFRVRCRTS